MQLPQHLNTYFKFKEKNGYSFTPEELTAFKESVVSCTDIKTQIIVVPETTNKNLLDVAQSLGTVQILKKSSTQEILDYLSAQPMMRGERKKLERSILTHKMADIAGNQRHRMIECWFQPLEISEPVTLLDDSAFSGYTLRAAQYALKAPIMDTITLFSYEST